MFGKSEAFRRNHCVTVPQRRKCLAFCTLAFRGCERGRPSFVPKNEHRPMRSLWTFVGFQSWRKAQMDILMRERVAAFRARAREELNRG